MGIVNRIFGENKQIEAKALTYSSPGHPEFTTHNLSTPVKSNQLLVKITHAGINPVDIKMMKTSFTWFVPGDKGMGRDFCGIIEEVGSGLNKEEWKKGGRVCGMKYHLVGRGTFATHAIITPGTDVVTAAPESLSDEEAAAFPLVFGTAFQGLSRAKLDKTSWVCVLGGTTSTGMFVTQLARKYFDVEKVVVTSSSEELARSLGADEVINYKHTKVTDGLKEVLGGNKKFQAIVDSVGGTEVLDRHQEFLEPRSKGSAYVTFVGDAAGDFYAKGEVTSYSYVPRMLARRALGFVGAGINYHLDLVYPGDWISKAYELFQNKDLRVVVDSTLNWKDYETGFQKISTGRVHGKVVLKMED